MNATVHLLRASVLLFAALSGSTAAATELTGYAVLTTDYVFRGVSYSDSHVAVQLGVTRPFGAIDFDLRYFDTSDWVPIISTPDRAKERIVLSARYQF